MVVVDKEEEQPPPPLLMRALSASDMTAAAAPAATTTSDDYTNQEEDVLDRKLRPVHARINSLSLRVEHLIQLAEAALARDHTTHTTVAI